MTHSPHASAAPVTEIRRAQDQARASGHSVYLFHDSRGWVIESDIRAVPMAAGVVEIHPDSGADRVNLGGC